MTYAEVLLIHIVTGAVSLLSGAAALAFKKGSKPHRISGNIFFVMMVLMAVTGAVLAIMKPQMIFILIGALSLYLVVTGWMTVMNKDNEIGVVEHGALVFIIISGIGALYTGLKVSGGFDSGDGFPPVIFYSLAGEAALFALLDISVIIRRGVSGKQRIARHLWRMCIGLFFGAFAFFIANPQVFPEALRGSFVLNLPLIAIVLVMSFWLIRVLFTSWWRDDEEVEPKK